MTEDAYDKHGRAFAIGDVVKVYHYTAALRRKRCYMYKQVTGQRVWPLGHSGLYFSHLNMQPDGGYYIMLDGRRYDDYEIVQSIDAKFEDRPRNSIPKAKP